MRKDKMFVLKQMVKECEEMHLDLQAEALREAIEAVEEKEKQEDGGCL